MTKLLYDEILDRVKTATKKKMKGKSLRHLEDAALTAAQNVVIKLRAVNIDSAITERLYPYEPKRGEDYSLVDMLVEDLINEW